MTRLIFFGSPVFPKDFSSDAEASFFTDGLCPLSPCAQTGADTVPLKASNARGTPNLLLMRILSPCSELRFELRSMPGVTRRLARAQLTIGRGWIGCGGPSVRCRA